jgi:pimeloyl-ACP methyl ester carboxylesterase
MVGRAADARRLGRFRNGAAQSRFLAAYDAAIDYWPTPPKHRDVATRFGTTHVLVSGPASGSPIVLLHAIAVSSPAWYADIAAFADAHPVYSIDTITDPGRSRQSAPVRSGDDYAAWLAEVLAALGLDRVHLVGLSYGGWLALNQARRSPDGLASVTAVDPVGAIGRGQASFLVKIVPDSLLALAKSEKAIHRLLRRLNNGTVPSQPLLDLSVAGLRTFRAKQPFPKKQSDAELGGIDLPTLLFFCGRSPVNRAHRAAERSRRCIPNVEVDVVADAGHMLPVEHPALFTERVLRFVDGIDATFNNGNTGSPPESGTP